jgi:hypothetical protein
MPDGHEEAVAAHRQAPRRESRRRVDLLEAWILPRGAQPFDEAKATFEHLRAPSPQSRTALNGLGIVAMMSGQPGEARSRFHGGHVRWTLARVTARQWLAVLEESRGNSHRGAKTVAKRFSGWRRSVSAQKRGLGADRKSGDARYAR